MEITYKNKKELIKDLITKHDTVLDVGFWGQGVSYGNKKWVHGIIKDTAKDVYGLDINFDKNIFTDSLHYKESSAEDFEFQTKFDVIFAGDLIEHLSNPGLFLQSSKKALKQEGRLILSTPNCFSLFNISEKITKNEPTVNHDHTCYFNRKTLSQLLGKNGFKVISVSYLYSLDSEYRQSFKKKILNFIYKILSLFTKKFYENIVIIATQK